ncbi:ethanolamine utilization microcompartment protein EutL [Thauera linaloolentis]|uniref:Ethanolamine utilization protein EutL n=1 Tax=Thauera linaloolentis (strain DSM 12138 / JCM 21573 / CCUG 41526 / CIP 105981 / IAM 15112 / NBRC 102519 / 47Lol) TaxID=1123367 RepID=N6Z030_THAL4|nr:ethanolamine utilization microcompartment protein EutL [Thauera linaloolentis]ENO85524.1 ethanolamine utilization protein EutL [Thauera linaloolentis 47Lol = DSM 12138]MCM8564759.1 ethanolamine utilization microcompartment protein EutL [Thauera linaloolentis]
MAAFDPIKPSVKAVRLIASVAKDFKEQLGLPAHMNSIGLLTADSDDVTYIAADEATKQAQVEVVYGRSLYAGAAHSSSPTAGEVIIMLGGPTPAEVKAGLDAMVATIENGPAFRWADDAHTAAFLAHLVSRTGSYLSAQAKIPLGDSIAYLIAPPLEALYGLDAAIKAADVTLATYIAPPSETNYAGAFLTGSQAACKAACGAFGEAVLEVGRDNIRY